SWPTRIAKIIIALVTLVVGITADGKVHFSVAEKCRSGESRSCPPWGSFFELTAQWWATAQRRFRSAGRSRLLRLQRSLSRPSAARRAHICRRPGAVGHFTRASGPGSGPGEARGEPTDHAQDHFVRPCRGVFRLPAKGLSVNGGDRGELQFARL